MASVDGLSAKCKDCQREYDKQRANHPHRVAAREAYQRTPRGRRACARAKRAWQERNAEKRAAHIILGNALRDGRVNKHPCEVCGVKRVQAHHDDYAKPLEVRWLCSKHHAAHHHPM